jgi:hypothetical protein
MGILSGEVNSSSPKHEDAGSSPVISSRPVVLADGTYAQPSTLLPNTKTEISTTDGISFFQKPNKPNFFYRKSNPAFPCDPGPVFPCYCYLQYSHETW